MMLLAAAPLLMGLVLQPTCRTSAPTAFAAAGRPSRCAVVLQTDMEALPAQLAEWGCDEELWSKIRGAKGSLRKMALDGDETGARKRIESIRKLVEEEEADPAAAAAKRAAAAESKKEAALAKKEQTV